MAVEGTKNTPRAGKESSAGRTLPTTLGWMIISVSFLKQVIFSGQAARAVTKIDSSLKSNCQIKLSLSKSLMYILPTYLYWPCIFNGSISV